MRPWPGVTVASDWVTEGHDTNGYILIHRAVDFLYSVAFSIIIMTVLSITRTAPSSPFLSGSTLGLM